MSKAFTLIICTYMRPKAILTLLKSVKIQSLYPNEILIIDGSINNETLVIFQNTKFKNLQYFKVPESKRGLTKQRNYGIEKVSKSSEIICFLDDDVILESTYFEQLILTYTKHPDAIAVGGYITNEVIWFKEKTPKLKNYFYYDGWMRKESLRFKFRAIFGLQPTTKPGFLPAFAHARSTSYLPPTDKIYLVEFFMGGVSSYKRVLFDTIKFSNYFVGYGLYEDLEFCLRAARLGKLYVNTSAKLEHYHEQTGRPNKFTMGKMIVRNSYYVWRTKYQNPSLKNRFKWNATTVLLMVLRGASSFKGNRKKEAFTESGGRFVGLLSLIFNKPNFQ